MGKRLSQQKSRVPRPGPPRGAWARAAASIGGDNYPGTGGKRDRIPQHLWHAAAQLCKNHSATRVSRYLRLSFADLKKHLPAGKNASPVRFMQIDFSRPNGNWQLCCQRGDGANFTVCANGPLPDIERLIEKFLP